MAKSSSELIRQRETALATKADPLSTFVRQLDGKADEFKKLRIDPARFFRIVITKIRQNPDLMEAAVTQPMALLGALMQIGQWNLDPAVHNEVHLVPYRDKTGKIKSVEAQQGYKGLLKLARRAARESGYVFDVLTAEVVHENDYFDLRLGDSPRCEHKPELFDPGAFVGAYAVAKTADSAPLIVWMSRPELEKHKARFSRSKFGPNADPDNFEAYAKKTVLRALINQKLDQTPVLSTAILEDWNAETAGGESDLAMMLETPQEDSAPVNGTAGRPEVGGIAVAEQQDATN